MVALLLAMHLSAPTELPLIPVPAKMQYTEGVFTLPDRVNVQFATDCSAENAALIRVLREAGARTNESRSGAKIKLSLVRTAEPDGAYRLSVSPSGIEIESGNRAGLFYGIQTLGQMLLGRGKAPFDLPSVRIDDEPRFPWRGMLLDVSRHFFTPDEIRKVLDDMAELKLNVFHWHLTDDGGWRMEVKKYPQLTEKGAWRTDISDVIWSQNQLEFPGKGSGKKLEGGYYTQDQIRDIVKYAADRHITIIPEIEVPGHSLAAMESYPEFSCDIETIPGYPYRTNVYCAGKDATMKFVQDILEETMALFPSKVIHIGGDEVDKSFWTHCPRCKERMAAKGISNYEELQSDFIKRVEAYVNSKGRTIIGWDEILEGGLAPNAWVMSWRGIEGGIAAAKSGHDVVMSPTSHCYFDYSYDAIPTEHVYGWEPVPAALSPEEARHVKGGQANVWTEWIPTLDRIEYLIYPRIYATAEVLWSPTSQRYWPSFQRRLEPHFAILARTGRDFFVGAPKFDANLVVFDGSRELFMESAPLPGIDLRYTLDGKDPDSHSPKWSGPLHIEKSQTVSAAYLRGSKLLTGVTKAVFLKGAPQGAPTPGLTYQLSKERFMKMPDWSKLSGLESGSAGAFDILPYVGLEAFAMRWTGYLNVDRAGLYSFTVGSDDGSLLRIAGATIVDNDGPHAYVEKSGKAYLLPGKYPFELSFFEAGGAERLEAWVTGPEGKKQPLAELVLR